MARNRPLDALERSILRILTEDDHPWTRDDVGEVFGERLAVTDALAELAAFGLLAEAEECVCPTRAALLEHW